MPETKAQLNRSQQMMRELLEERRELLVVLNRLAGTVPGERKHTPSPQELQNFCQLLVDYAATGHFGLYEAIRNEGACQGVVWELAGALYPEVAATTDALLDFNDKYTSEVNCLAVVDDLPADLSGLGEGLEERFQMEDLLIESLHNAHRGVVA